MSKKILYRNVIRFEVLSEEPIDSGVCLADIVRETVMGDWSGNVQFQKENEVVMGKRAVKLVCDHGTDLDFFNMDEQGNDLYFDDSEERRDFGNDDEE